MPAVDTPHHVDVFISGLLTTHLRQVARTSETVPCSLQGVVLFIDIVSSTSMTDRICSSGAEGAERLGGFLNQYFGEVIAAITEHGGDVVRIDGDAIIALWHVEERATSAYALAARTAMAVRDVRPYWPVSPPERLQHRIVLVAGKFTTLVLPTAGRRKFLLLSGAPLRTIESIIRSGPSGTILLGEDVAGFLIDMAECIRSEGSGADAVQSIQMVALRDTDFPVVRSDNRRAESTDTEVDAFVPRILLERDLLRLSEWLAEFRTVSVVFARLGAPDISRSSLADLQPMFKVVADAAEAMGTEVFDIVADEKGVIAKIAVGLPLFGSEDNATRAVEIGQRIRDGLARRDVPYAVGITTGRVFCGDVGSEIRREYVLNGPAMNYGARLMQAAKNAVFCDSETMQATAARFVYNPHGTILIRGRDEPLQVYELVAARAALYSITYTTALHGRGREMSELFQALDALRRGHGGIIAIEAEPGGGKSRLLAEVSTVAQAMGYAVVRAANDAIERATPYFAFRTVLRQLLLFPETMDDQSTPELRALLQNSLSGTALLSRAALIEDVMPLGIEDPGLAAQIRGGARRSGVEDILVELCGRPIRQRKLLLLIDDLQWIDALSADLLLGIASRLPEMLVVTASRPREASGTEACSRVLMRANKRIALGPLDAIATADMVSELLGVRTVQRRLSTFIHEQSEGLPIHVEQLVLSLREQRLIETANLRAWSNAPVLTTASIPVKLRSIIVSRVDRLRQSEQLAAKVASVVGDKFDLAMLRLIYPLPIEEAELEQSARVLSDAGLFARLDGSYAFRHRIIREAIYELLSYAQRRALHGAVAEVIERQPGPELAQRSTELAHHWEYAGNSERAAQYCLLAAEFGIRRFAHNDVLANAAHIEKLVESAALKLSPEQRRRLMYVRGEALHGLSRFTEAERDFQEALRITGIQPPATRIRLFLSTVCQIVLQGIHRLGIIRRPRLEYDKERTKLSAHLHTRFAEHGYFMRDSLALLHGAVTALNCAESVNSYPEMIEGYGGIAIGLGTAGMHRMARSYRDRCISVSRSLGGLPDQAFANLLAGVYSYQAGEWMSANRYCEDGVALCERLGDHFRRQSCRVVGCFSAIATGDYARAEQGFAEFGEDVETIDNAPVRAWVLAGMSVLDMLRGYPPDRTLARIDLARDALLHRAEILLCDGLEAAALLRSGDVEEAGRIATRALRDMQDNVCTMGIAMYSVCAVADVFLTLASQSASIPGTGVSYASSARAACRAARRYAAQTRICRPRANLLESRLALLEGRPRTASARAATALAQAEQLQMPLELGLAYLALSESRPTDDTKALAERGVALVQSLGANPWFPFCSRGEHVPSRSLACS